MKWQISLFLIIILFVLQCHQKNENEIPEILVPVKLASVEHKVLSKPVRMSGRLASSTEMKLSFKIGGIVESVNVVEGQKVKKGTILASLKSDEIDAKVQQAKAGLEKSQRDYERVKRLYGDSVATLEQVQDARTGFKVAGSNLKIAQFNMEHARIIAPEDGIVLKVLAEENELVGAGYPICLFGNQTKNWKVIAGLTDQEIVKISIGDSAIIKFDAYSTQPLEAIVTEIAGAPDPMSGTYEVVLEFMNNELKLYSGFIAKIEIAPQKRESAALIPFVSLVDVHDNTGEVFVPLNNSQVQKTKVKIKYLVDDMAVIASGLDSVQQVVAEGTAYLREGTKVKIIE